SARASGCRIRHGSPLQFSVQVATGHVLATDEADMNAAGLQPLHALVDRVVSDLVLARVREPCDALEGQRVVADLLPAELEPAPASRGAPEVIDRAIRGEEPLSRGSPCRSECQSPTSSAKSGNSLQSAESRY